jgi:uncharacterized protein
LTVRLWAGLSTHFVRDAAHNQIAEKLRAAFFQHYRYEAPPSEVHAWRNSLRAMADVFEDGGLDDHGVMLEYRLPLTSRRLDCLVCGHDASGAEQAVIIELKQWERCASALGDRVVTFLGGAEREVLHPSAQVGQYRQYLRDAQTAFYDGDRPIGLAACAYLHNYFAVENDALFAAPFEPLLAEYPVFTGDDVDRLARHLVARLEAGDGLSVLQRIEESRYRPSRKLMDHVAEMIRGEVDGNPQYHLIDEQELVRQKILATARDGFHDRRKTVLLVRGGPGTGKSVIAIKVMADLLREQYNTHYATGSRAFTETLRSVVGSRAAIQFKYFNTYVGAKPNEIDVLICDEAHRIRETSNSRYTPKASRSKKPQIHELLDAAKVAVFLIDDKQGVRPDEIGSAAYIREAAASDGCRLFEYELEAQFRCGGSEGFVRWVDNTLGLARTANVLWDPHDDFDFRIMESPQAVEAAIRAKAADGSTARMVAGFCWKWSDPLDGGTLVDDVVVGDYARPWNAKQKARRLAPGIPRSDLWARDAAGIDQVGCVYTAQGFEFDYVGVIFGTDLTYDYDRRDWVGHPDRSHDKTVKRAKNEFTELVKNTYRVLLTRGLRGCYVCFVDRDTERFVRSRVE